MRDVDDMPGWMYDERLLGDGKTSVDAHFSEERARELGRSEDEIKNNNEKERKNDTVTVCLQENGEVQILVNKTEIYNQFLESTRQIKR